MRGIFCILISMFVGQVFAQQKDTLMMRIGQTKNELKKLKAEYKALQEREENLRRDTLRTISYRFPIQMQVSHVQHMIIHSKASIRDVNMNSNYANGIEGNFLYILQKRMRLGVSAGISRLKMNTVENVKKNTAILNMDSTQAHLIISNQFKGISLFDFSLSFSYLFKLRKYYLEPFIKPSLFIFNYKDDYLYYFKSSHEEKYINLAPRKSNLSYAICGGIAVRRYISRHAQIQLAALAGTVHGRHQYIVTEYNLNTSSTNYTGVASPKYVIQTSIGFVFSPYNTIHSGSKRFYKQRVQRRPQKYNF
jgi:hypothetical protein